MAVVVPLLQILNPKIEEAVLVQRLSEMCEQGYQCVGAYDNKKLVAICGLWIITKYYIGKHIEPDNMIISPEYRSKGLGKDMMKWVYEYGQSQGCVASELNCYLTNEAANRFWANEGYERIAYHYQKPLKP